MYGFSEVYYLHGLLRGCLALYCGAHSFLSEFDTEVLLYEVCITWIGGFIIVDLSGLTGVDTFKRRSEGI